jgi:hypothetical protein
MRKKKYYRVSVVDPSYAYLGNVNYVFMGIFTTQAAASNAMSAYVVIANMCQKYAPQVIGKNVFRLII